MSPTTDRIRDLVAPIVAELELSVYDIEHTGGVLRISLFRPGGVDLGSITEATRRISAELDAADPIPTRYTLEVSSPGLERTLRTAEHFSGAVGESVKIKVRKDVEGERRVEGELVGVDESHITLREAGGEPVRVALADIERARTHVDWSPPPKPGGPRKGGSSPKKRPVPDTGTTSPNQQSEATS